MFLLGASPKVHFQMPYKRYIGCLPAKILGNQNDFPENFKIFKRKFFKMENYFPRKEIVVK